MTATYDLVATSIPTTNVAQIDFTNLGTVAASYRDLILVMDVEHSGGGFQTLDVRVNNSSTSGYSWSRITGTGTATEGDGASGQTYWRMGAYSLDTDQRGLIEIHFMDFSQTNKHRVALARISKKDREVDMRALRLGVTTAITSINVFFSTSFKGNNCRLYLYGIVA